MSGKCQKWSIITAVGKSFLSSAWATSKRNLWSIQWRLDVESNLWSWSCLGGALTDLYVHTAMPIRMYRHYPRVPVCAHPGFWKTRLFFLGWVLKGHLTKMQCHSALKWCNIFRIIISWWQDSYFRNYFLVVGFLLLLFLREGKRYEQQQQQNLSAPTYAHFLNWSPFYIVSSHFFPHP